MGALVVAPRPTNPIGNLADVELIVRCRCGRGLEVRVGQLAARHRLPPDTPLVVLVNRLRCTGCRRGFPAPPGQGRPGTPPAPEAVVEVPKRARVSPLPPLLHGRG